MRRADAGTGEHCDGRLGDHRQVDGHAVTLGDAQVLQRVGCLLDVAVQVGVGDVLGVTGLADEVDRDLVTFARLDVAVDTVVRRVQLAADEPLGERSVAPVEGLAEVLAPRQVRPRLLGPEGLVVLGGLVVERRLAIGLRSELPTRRELAVFVGQVLKGLVGHSILQRAGG